MNLKPFDNFIISSTNIQKGFMRLKNGNINRLINHMNSSSSRFHPQEKSQTESFKILFNSTILLLQEAEFGSRKEHQLYQKHLEAKENIFLSDTDDPAKKSRILVHLQPNINIIQHNILHQFFQLTSLMSKSISDLLISVNNELVLIVSCYASTNTIERNLFLFQLNCAIKWFNKHHNSSQHTRIIVGGDFNSIYDHQDSSNFKIHQSQNLSKELMKSLMQLNNLTDSFHSSRHHQQHPDRYTNNNTNSSTKRRLDYIFIFNPIQQPTQYFRSCFHSSHHHQQHTDRYTNNNNNSSTKRRLDYIFIFNPIQQPTQYFRSTIAFPGSTHNAIAVMFQSINSKSKKIKNFQKKIFNDQLIMNSPEYRDEIIGQQFFNHPDLKNLLPFTKFDCAHRNLTSYLQSIQDIFFLHNASSADHLKTASTSLKIRSQLIYNNPHQVNILFKQKLNNQIDLSSLAEYDSKTNGKDPFSEASVPTSFLNKAKSFYQNLYQEQDITGVHQFLNDFPLTISQLDQKLLKKPLTLEELETSLYTLSKKKSSPGEDGLSYRFIKSIFKDIGPTLLDVSNSIRYTGFYPTSLTNVIITLIPKKNFSKTKSIEDLRPIALNNSCLKIIAHAYNKRIVQILESQIHFTQAGFVPERQIENLLLEYTAIYSKLLELSATSNSRIPSPAALLIDFRKAFDLLSHKYIDLVLRKMNFPKEFINVITAIQEIKQLR
ncbi:hypothetical protein WICMUC_001165 [Wickerhamomyces mucosus]|uniref:Reverse transcriptase domain-containing protein n=1 Tax=Wickerhamomyces mucosus TaxID=1378264 RepID=A0A9P8PXQ2_9ASCO|nr:hypothetical protein WICMUC_001165 [Wickerhamomyces mucosus]